MPFKIRVSLFLLVVFTIGIASCNSNRVFNETHTFLDYQWPVEEKLIFKPQLNSDQSGKKYELQINLRYIQGFPYKNLNLLITVTRPDGTQAEKEESIQTRDDNADYIGDGAGSYWDLDYTIKEAFLFEQAGEYKIEISPVIEKSPVYFINEIGLSIVKIDK